VTSSYGSAASLEAVVLLVVELVICSFWPKGFSFDEPAAEGLLGILPNVLFALPNSPTEALELVLTFHESKIPVINETANMALSSFLIAFGEWRLKTLRPKADMSTPLLKRSSTFPLAMRPEAKLRSF
jgi:hypothetical protein